MWPWVTSAPTITPPSRVVGRIEWSLYAYPADVEGQMPSGLTEGSWADPSVWAMLRSSIGEQGELPSVPLSEVFGLVQHTCTCVLDFRPTRVSPV